jgi:hypothetical protein
VLEAKKTDLLLAGTLNEQTSQQREKRRRRRKGRGREYLKNHVEIIFGLKAIIHVDYEGILSD